MDPGDRPVEELLSVTQVAHLLGVQPVTVYRWCRQGRLSCLKPGKSWRIRRTALEAFLHRTEPPQTLAARLGAFLELPDQVLAVAEDAALLAWFDAAFYLAGDARGAHLAKLYEPRQMSRRTLAAAYRQCGLETEWLEAAGRLEWCPLSDPQEVIPVLQDLVARTADDERPLWVTINWTETMSLALALQQQTDLAELVAVSPLVVATGVVEPAAETWPSSAQQWQLLGSLRGVIRFARAGLMLSRVMPAPSR